jgi:hypothetical protein
MLITIAVEISHHTGLQLHHSHIVIARRVHLYGLPILSSCAFNAEDPSIAAPARHASPGGCVSWRHHASLPLAFLRVPGHYRACQHLPPGRTRYQNDDTCRLNSDCRLIVPPDTTDPYKCKALLNQGHWLDLPDRNTDFRPFHEWRVPGCLLREYTAVDIASCSEGGQILFVGDTGTRQVFWATARKIAEKRDFQQSRQSSTDQHDDLYISAEGVDLQFLWDPWLNSTTLGTRLTMFEKQNAPPLDEKSVMTTDKRPEPGLKLTLIFIGGGLWHARHLGNDGLARFKRDVDRISAAAHSASPVNKLQAGRNVGIDDQIVFAPVFEPLYDRLSPSREGTIIPSMIEAMDEYLAEQSKQGLNVPWAYRNMTKNWPELVGNSGMHVDARVADKMADVLLNFRCNAKAAQKEGFPFDQTCCSAYRRLNWVQILIAIGFFPLLSPNKLKHIAVNTVLARCGKFVIFATPLAIAIDYMVLAAYYCFLADRTHIFEKSPKKFAYVDFRILLGIAVVVCLLNIKPTSPTRSQHMASFLPREQSDESKGWMQIYVLVYGYTGASRVVDFDEFVRIFIAGYIFLSAYGHTTYFLQTKDYSFQRIAGVLLRVNILAVILAFAMNRPYASYFFAPLISFWFLFVYATLRIGQQHNDSCSLLIGKIVVAAVLATGFIHVKGGIELTGTLLRLLLIQIDLTQWRFFLSTDKYMPFFGMLVAVLHIEIASVLRSPCGHLPFAGRVIKRYFRVIQAQLVVLSFIVIPGFWIFVRQPFHRHDRHDYYWWTPCITWLPVIAFFVLRNATTFLRNHYCASFAWLGSISLELCLLLNHIWLAGDGHGLLRLGFRGGDGGLFNDRWCDLVILTPIFLWLAWKVHDATRTIANWILHIEQRAPPVGLGIDGLYDYGDEEDIYGKGNDSKVIDVEVARNSTGTTGSSVGLKWRLQIVYVGVLLANFVSYGSVAFINNSYLHY